MYNELIFLGLACVASAYLAKGAGYKNGRKAFNLVGVGGVFFLMSAGFGIGIAHVASLATIGGYLFKMSVLAGWAMLTLGGISGVLEVVRDLDHILVHKKA